MLDDRIRGGQAPGMGREVDEPASCAWPHADVRHWGLPRVPFPVTVPYRPRPELVRLDSVAHGRLERQVLDADDDAPDALREKWARLRGSPGRCIAFDEGLAGDAPAVWARVRAAAVAIAQADAMRGTRVGAAPSVAPGSPGSGGGASSGRGGGDDAARPEAPFALVDGEVRAGLAGWAFPADPAAPFALRALRADAGPVLDWIASRPAAERPLHALALALQEDVAWMEQMPGESVRARMLHVCFPSGWDPASKIGLDFAAIHAPVADADRLRASAIALARALTTQGPFVRFVWTVAPDGRRSRHPSEAAAWPASAQPWFRCERQVSLPLAPVSAGAGAAALFLIRLHRAPLASAASSRARLRTLRDALVSMSAATRSYKGLDGALPDLLDWLERRLVTADPNDTVR
jgi:hypothetical protein